MDRLAHFHFIIIFSSHRWSSTSFCSAAPAPFPFHPPSPLASSSFILLHPISLPSFLSFPREINTHGWTGRATGEPRRLGDELGERVPPRTGKKLRNAKYYCASSPPPVLSRDLTSVIILTRAHRPRRTYAEAGCIYVHVVLIIHYMTYSWSYLSID